MSFNEEALDVISRYCRVYNLIYRKTDAGILVDNGFEYFVLKLKARKVRKMFHQNYNKGQKKVLPVAPSELDNDTMRALFHDQKWTGDDIQQALRYISRHAGKRKVVDTKRRELLAQIGL